MMLQQDSPLDLVIATGRTESLQYFDQSAFAYFNLDCRHYVRKDKDLLRPSDIIYSAANISLPEDFMGWTARHSVDDVVRKMYESESERWTWQSQFTTSLSSLFLLPKYDYPYTSHA
jgi:GDPmannose 4,6-dehydratase